MMRSFDISFLVPLLISEPRTKGIENFFANLPEDASLLFSLWGQLELASVAARLFRMGDLSENDAQAVIDQFNRLLIQSFRLRTPTGHDFRKAREFVGDFQTRLRGGDALHLAMAANLGVEMIHTLDNGMLEAGNLLGLAVQGLHYHR
jgi:predicted nucleic acid-binding protein